MTRFPALFLRLSVIASAVAMLVVCARAAHAQGFQPAPYSPAPYSNGQPAQPAQYPDTAPSPPLGLNGAPDPYAYYKPPPPQVQGYYNSLTPPLPQTAAPYMPAPTAPQYAQAPAPRPQYAAAPQGAAPQYAAPPPQQFGAAAPPPNEPGYTLGAGDKVHVTVFGEEDLSGEYQLDGNGMIRLPLIGTLRAAGYTAPGLEAWIRGALSPAYLKNPRVNVEITTYRPIYVVGAVAKPGQYAYANDMSMLNAVALAGGFTEQAVQSTVYVRREGSTVEEPVSTETPLLIQPGDTVRVRVTPFWQAMNMLSPLAGPAAIAATASR